MNGFTDTYTHDPELHYNAIANLHNLQITTLLSLCPACCVSNNRSLATASNSGDSSASRAHVVTVRRISRNGTHSTDLDSSLYSLGADPKENTGSNSCSIVVMGGYLAIILISLTWSPAVTKQRMFLLAITAKQRYYTLQYEVYISLH
jgi:hypothetical protein